MSSLLKPSRRLVASPVWPALLSAFVAPGVGQIVNREFSKGVFLLLASVTSFLWFSKVLTERLSTVLSGTPEQWAANQTALREALLKLINQNSDMFLTFQVLIILIWGYGVIDAYITARNLRKPPPPLSDEN